MTLGPHKSGKTVIASAKDRQQATYFARPERADLDLLESQINVACEHPITSMILKTLGGVALILNRHRQAVAANDALFAMLDISPSEEVLGLRPGEAFRCIHVENAPNGCGTGPACRACGAVLAVVESQTRGSFVEEECFLTRQLDHHNEAVEFLVRAGPVSANGHEFTIVTFQDIREKKLFYALQRVFLHDILNYLQGLQGYADLLSTEEESHPFAREIVSISDYLLECIYSHRDLIAMENNEYTLRSSKTTIGQIFQTARKTVYRLFVTKEIRLITRSDGTDMIIRTDPPLLSRIIVNMVKNALEATDPGGEVRLTHSLRNGAHLFEVWNAAKIPETAARRIFQRYFTTKTEKGRGLGTYSMKLIGERYLKGRVDFETSDEGTTFRFRLPVRPAAS